MCIRTIIAAAALTMTASAASAHDMNNYRPHTTHSANTPEYITAQTYTPGPASHMYIPHYEDPGVVVISRRLICSRCNIPSRLPVNQIYTDPTANTHNLPRMQIYNN